MRHEFDNPLKKLSPFTVELPNKRLIHKPSFLFCGDCRICALLNIVCEELEYPCPKLIDQFPTCLYADCEKCHRLTECLESKPRCWECDFLEGCLERASEWAFDYVKDNYGCPWEQYVEAINLLKGGK